MRFVCSMKWIYENIQCSVISLVFLALIQYNVHLYRKGDITTVTFLGKSVITHFNKASLLFHSFVQASKDHMYMEGVPSLSLELHLFRFGFSHGRLI